MRVCCSCLSCSCWRPCPLPSVSDNVYAQHWYWTTRWCMLWHWSRCWDNITTARNNTQHVQIWRDMCITPTILIYRLHLLDYYPRVVYIWCYVSRSISTMCDKKCSYCRHCLTFHICGILRFFSLFNSVLSTYIAHWPYHTSNYLAETFWASFMTLTLSSFLAFDYPHNWACVVVCPHVIADSREYAIGWALRPSFLAAAYGGAEMMWFAWTSLTMDTLSAQPTDYIPITWCVHLEC